MAVTKTCPRCGKEFQTKGGSSGTQYCSGACYHADRKGVLTAQSVKFTCRVCGEPFTRQPGELRSYRKQWGKDPLYCSTKCGGIGRKLPDEKWQVHCIQCGKPMPIQRRPGGTINRQKKLCSTECRSKFRSERAPKIEGITRELKRNGYVWLSIPIHLSGTGRRERVQEHRHVMEQVLGRRLFDHEEVHHLNGQRGDNRPQNLEIWSTRQPRGQRIPDKIAFAIEMLRLYPEYARSAGVELRSVDGEGGHAVAQAAPRSSG